MATIYAVMKITSEISVNWKKIYQEYLTIYGIPVIFSEKIQRISRNCRH